MMDFAQRIQLELERLQREGTLIEEVEPEIQCAYCGDMGMVRANVDDINHPLFGKMLPCPNKDCAVSNERRRTQWQKRLLASKLPPRYEKCTFASWQKALDEEAFEAKRLAYEAARAFCSDDRCKVNLYDICTSLGIEWDFRLDSRPKNSLVLHGDFGVGKTGLAAAAFNCRMRKGDAGMYVDCNDIFLDIRDTFHEDADESIKAVFIKYQNAPLLFIDDLQTLTEKDFRIETIDAIIAHRHAKMLPTLVTTNLTQNQFRDLWKGRAADRLAQMSHWLFVPPPDLRVKNPSIGGEA